MRKRVRELLQRRAIDEIADLAGHKRRVLSTLVSLTFDRDTLIGWRAVEAMATAAERIAEEDVDCVRDHVRRLHWHLSEESGGVCWRAPEAMAEIIRRVPALACEYAPIVVSLIGAMAEEDLDHFRPGILWAIGRLGPMARDQLPTVLPAITAALDDRDPQVRGMAAWCLGQVGQASLLAARPDLLGDQGPVDLYEDGHLRHTSVCRLVRRAVDDG